MQHDRHQHGGGHRRFFQQPNDLLAIDDFATTRDRGEPRREVSSWFKSRLRRLLVRAWNPGWRRQLAGTTKRPASVLCRHARQHRERHQFGNKDCARLTRASIEILAVAFAHPACRASAHRSRIVRDTDRMISRGDDLIGIGMRNDRICCLPSPPQSSSTAMNGASSTSMRPRSAGVRSHHAPSASRRNTEENKQTSSFRGIWRPARDTARMPYRRRMRNGRSPHSIGTRGARGIIGPDTVSFPWPSFPWATSGWRSQRARSSVCGRRASWSLGMGQLEVNSPVARGHPLRSGTGEVVSVIAPSPISSGGVGMASQDTGVPHDGSAWVRHLTAMGKRYDGGVWRLPHRGGCREAGCQRDGCRTIGQREALGPGTDDEFAIGFRVITSRVKAPFYAVRAQASLHLDCTGIAPGRSEREADLNAGGCDRTTRWFPPPRCRSVSR